MQVAAAIAERYPLLNDLLTKRAGALAAGLAALILTVNALGFAQVLATSTDNVTVHGPPIGGDYLVFDAAATGAARGEAAALYDVAAFRELMRVTGPPAEIGQLTWQYPPTMLLFLLPLSLFPFLTGYALFVGVSGAAFLASLRQISKAPSTLFLALAAPASFISLITGQTGFAAAALLTTAGLCAGKQPALAGIAAGLLTVKPQLGLLLPLCFAVAGCWRAFLAAAVTAILLALVSLAVFGADAWMRFPEAMFAQGARMELAQFPHYKLLTPFGGASMLGAPHEVALGVQILASVTMAAGVAIIWRRTDDALLRLAALAVAAPLVVPYAFFYEAVIFAPAVFALARIGMERGFLPGEKLLLAAFWFAPTFLPGAKDGFPVGFAVAALGLALVWRRAAHEGLFRGARI